MPYKILGELHYKPVEVAKLLHVHLITVRRWLKEDEVASETSKRFPRAFQTRSGRWWIPAADIKGWTLETLEAAVKRSP